jgi:hypothetical protein
MAEFLVRRGGPNAVTVSAKMDTGTVSAKFPVRSNGTVRKVTVPDGLVSSIAPEQAKFLVRLNTPAQLAPESEPPSGPDEQPTMPATPHAFKRRDEE